MRTRWARTRLTAVALALTMVAVPWTVWAQPGVFPTRPITFVVGFAPGGGADVFARALADAARTTLPQALAVETIETFGRHVLPQFDKDPVHRTTRMREGAA